MITARYIARAYVGALVAALAGMSALYLIVDFADRAKFYEGAGWLTAVVELYACKLALVVYQLAPAGLGLGAAIAMSGLRKTGEVTALRALGRGPGTFAWPVGLVALAIGLAITALEDRVVVPANYRAEEITALRFHRWGDWSAYHNTKRWFRGQNNRVYFLGRLAGQGFADVTLYDLTPDFRLARRIDARSLEPMPDGQWKLSQVVTRTFAPDATMHEVREDERLERFPEDVQLFRVKTGRPQQLKREDLPPQIALREKLGLPSREFELALQERRAYQLVGVPAALIGLSLALRRNRRGHLTAAISEGFAVTIGLWTLTVLARTLSLAGHLPPLAAGWLPLTVASLVAAAALRLAR